MSMRTIRNDGLPDWFLSRPIAVASGVVLALGVLAILTLGSWIGSLFDSSDDPYATPACFTSNLAPVAPGNKLFDPDSLRSKDQLARTAYGKYERDMQAAAQNCATDACASAAQAAYRDAAFWYVSGRATHARKLYASFGDRGLSYSLQLYDTDNDAALVAGMRDRFKAGVFDPVRLGKHKDAPLILMARTAYQFRPCSLSE